MADSGRACGYTLIDHPGALHGIQGGGISLPPLFFVLIFPQGITGGSAMTKANDAQQHFDNYSEYSKTLRSWLVAYGIGGPVLFLTNKDAPVKIAQSPHLELIVVLFVGGVALQIFLAFINKWAAWNIYKGELQADYQDGLTYKVWRWINDQSWIDVLIDLGALISFSIATYMVLSILLSR
jgi:hypothetical protein